MPLWQHVLPQDAKRSSTRNIVSVIQVLFAELQKYKNWTGNFQTQLQITKK